MFTRTDAAPYRLMAPGVEMRTLCHGQRTLTTEFRLTAGHELPSHSHPHEQTGYLVSGRIMLRIGDEVHEATPGSSWTIGSSIEHGATIVEDSVTMEVFSPLREDLLASEPG